jgi:hypothetical protein
MDIKYLEFSRVADRVVTDPSLRGRILATGIGIALASKLSLPSLQLEVSPENYFTAQVGLSLTDLIARFNEEVVFDTRYCREVVRTFWLLRYSAAYPGAQFFAPPTLGFVDSVVGATLYLAEEMHCFCNEHKDAIFALVREALCVVKTTEAADVGAQ